MSVRFVWIHCLYYEGWQLKLFPWTFRRGYEPLLGIDVGASAIKLVELGGVLDQPTVLRCAAQSLEKGWVAEGNVEKFDEVADALRRLLRVSGAKTRRAALALPSASVIARKLTIPDGLGEDALEVHIESEAAQHLPFPIAEVALDYCVMGSSPTVAGALEVLMVAARKDKVADRQGLAEAAGLEPVIIDVESYAARLAAARIIQALPDQGKGRLIALFEIGSLSTSLQVLRGDEVIYERDQPIGGFTLTQSIARRYALSTEEAERKKKMSVELPTDYPQTVLQPFLDTLAQEMERALQFFFTSTPHNRVDHVLLSGGTASLPGMADIVAKVTGFDTRVLDPFDGMVGGVKIASGLAPTAFLVATGLALRRFHP